MSTGNIKRQGLLYLAIGVFACVLGWKISQRVSTPGFVNRAAPPASTKVPRGPQAPPGSVLVRVTMVGFEPASIEAKAGQPIKLAFFRLNAANCGREVVFPDLGIEKELPPGETVVIEITPAKTGALEFACGMNMLKGQLIVR